MEKQQELMLQAMQVLYEKLEKMEGEWSLVRDPPKDNGKVHLGLIPTLEIDPELTPEAYEMAEDAFEAKKAAVLKIQEDKGVDALTAELDYFRFQDGCNRDENGCVPIQETTLQPCAPPKCVLNDGSCYFPPKTDKTPVPAMVRWVVEGAPPHEELLKLTPPPEVIVQWNALRDAKYKEALFQQRVQALRDEFSQPDFKVPKHPAKSKNKTRKEKRRELEESKNNL